jgi:tungstate transport system substrate-binding protein
MQNFIVKYVQKIAGVLFFLMLAAHSSHGAAQQLLLATTTSTDNTGLLDYLAPQFTEATGIQLKWVATGTGKALKLGENCDADVLMVHAPDAEKTYVEAGFGVNRRQIMYNDFVFIGPESDPAGIKGHDVCASLKAIMEKKAVFASRGDNSGTNKKEISLWTTCTENVPEKQQWYLQTGQGMLATINMAAERGGYTMTDRGTFIKYEANHNGSPPLRIVVEGDDSLMNQYSVIEVNPERCPKVQNALAASFGDWLVSSEGQEAIGSFRLLDKQLFPPGNIFRRSGHGSGFVPVDDGQPPHRYSTGLLPWLRRFSRAQIHPDGGGHDVVPAHGFYRPACLRLYLEPGTAGRVRAAVHPERHSSRPGDPGSAHCYFPDRDCRGKPGPAASTYPVVPGGIRAPGFLDQYLGGPAGSPCCGGNGNRTGPDRGRHFHDGRRQYQVAHQDDHHGHCP